jgi:hypothetical protein
MRWITVGPAGRPDTTILPATRDLDGTSEMVRIQEVR